MILITDEEGNISMHDSRIQLLRLMSFMIFQHANLCSKLHLSWKDWRLLTLFYMYHEHVLNAIVKVSGMPSNMKY